MPNAVQQCILSIAKDLDSFCRSHQIEYFLMGGSALGAMRHHGFIPWDDDLDVFMTVENYEKFLTCFEHEGDGKYFLQKQNTPEWPLFISQVCLKGTTMVSEQWKHNMKQHHNVFVDIMCLYSAPNSRLLRYIQFMAAQLLRVNALELCGFPQNSRWKLFLMKLCRLAVNSVTKPLLINLVKRWEGKQTQYVGHYFGRARFCNAIFLRKYIGSPRYVDFEDTELPVFEHVEEYLVARFGLKWIEMPDQKTRDMYPQHGDFIDLERDYAEYMTQDKKNWIIS